MIFGLSYAPATFQAIMNIVLQKFLDHSMLVYLNDILIHSENEEDHIELVQQVVAEPEDYALAVSTTKWIFHIEEGEFLGYIVEVDGVTMSERKVQSIKDWKHPRLVKKVQIFIGFADINP